MDKKRMTEIDKLFVTSLNNNIFQCGAIAFSKWDKDGYQRFEKYYGLVQEKPSQIKLTKDSFFDLASLTKPFVTVLVLLALFEKNIINSETELAAIYPDCPADKKRITIQELMSHMAGFVPHREYFNELITLPEKIRKEVLLQRILDEKLQLSDANNTCYSDLGFMLLGLLIEKLTNKKLGELAEVMIYKPLKLQNDLFFPESNTGNGHTYVSTENCLWDKEKLSGRVHDDNCRAIGGQAGHAGLFGTLQGVMGLCENLLDIWKDRGQHSSFSNELLQHALTRVGDSSWTMGFDMVSEKGSSSGSNFSKESVGHLGFTGTSFWIDPEKECIAVLLTNRVYYGRDNLKIRKFRPVLHDLLMRQ